MTPVIEARGLCRAFEVSVSTGWLRRQTRVVAAVDGIDLIVDRGEMLGYIGANGAGKSTTLKMLTGVLYPSGGDVRVCGLVPVPQRTRLARRIGVVFGCRLFLDEPTIGLDVVSKQAVRAFRGALGATGDTTIVLTTHDLADIERLCRRLVVVDQGRVVLDGSLEDLHARYGSRRRVVVDLDEPLATPITLAYGTISTSRLTVTTQRREYTWLPHLRLFARCTGSARRWTARSPRGRPAGRGRGSRPWSPRGTTPSSSRCGPR